MPRRPTMTMSTTDPRMSYLQHVTDCKGQKLQRPARMAKACCPMSRNAPVELSLNGSEKFAPGWKVTFKINITIEVALKTIKQR